MNVDSFRFLPKCSAALLALAIVCGSTNMQRGFADETGDGVVELPVPRTASNGALHYQRALLFLAAVDPAKRELLREPIWQILDGTSDAERLAEINELLIESRHAIGAALVGAEQENAEFGISPTNYVETSLLPHVETMVDLGKLVLLYGVERESRGDWAGAVDMYIQALRMGRHMAHQTTFAEALTGVEILEAGYYVLGLWGVHCPQQQFVEDASLTINVFSGDMVDPAGTLIHELGYTKLQMARLREAFPDGPWAAMILEVFGEEIPSVDQAKMRDAAIAAAAKRGIPKDVFGSKQAFDDHLDKLRTAHVALARATVEAMTLPNPAAVKRGHEIYEAYSPRLRELGSSASIDPGRIAAYFATHDAELVLLKVVLALAASKGENGFSSSLDELADRFGGQVPHSPYDDQPLHYETTENGGFRLAVRPVNVGDIELPRIEFKFDPE